MNDFKLKLVLSVLGGIVFSFIFILLSFALPTKEKTKAYEGKPKNKLGIISKSLRDN